MGLTDINLKAMWNYKCPRCRKGDMFAVPFDISKPLDMPKNCSHCNQRFEPEVGFYYGAMFLSYILSCFIFLPIILFLVFGLKWSMGAAIGIMALVYAISFFRMLRGSRALWLHMVVNYDPTTN
jgi:uncharacterized protein (DUF983 family)